MVARSGNMEQTLDLPPGYTLVALREVGDAFAHGCKIAAEAGAGTLVWVRVRTVGLKGVMGAWSDPGQIRVP